jgi:hypothetical protein
MPFQTRGSPVATGAPLDSQQLAAPRTPGRTHTCPKCETVLRVTGIGRHRVFFVTTDELLDDPVMNRVCPRCGDRLPGK